MLYSVQYTVQYTLRKLNGKDVSPRRECVHYIDELIRKSIHNPKIQIDLYTNIAFPLR